MERRKLLTIVTESNIESLVTDDLKRLGARGYTACDAWGEGARGARKAEWEQNRNVRIEVVCDDTTAKAITEHLTKTYYDHYAMVVYLSDVEVVRPAKF